MTLQARLKTMRDALITVTTNCYHYYNSNPVVPYIVWAEDGEADSFHADNGKERQAIHGTVDYYTKTEFDSKIDSIQSTLDGLGCPWTLLSVQYEEETNLIHYEWEFILG